MAETFDVVVIVGSLRKASFNRKIALALQELAPASLQLEIVEIGQLSLYDQDYDNDGPAEYAPFRARVERADAVLIVTPEHNRSMPAALKNAIDIGSRPPGQNKWSGKPAAIVTASISAIGGFGSNHHLRQSLVAVGMPAMPQPEAYIGKVKELLDEETGKLDNEHTREFLRTFMQAFAAWVARF